MKELIDKLFAALPAFGRQFTALLLGPKSGLHELDLESDTALQQALTFLTVSVGIAYIAQIPLLPGHMDKELQFGLLAIVSGLSFALMIVSLILTWRIVGARVAGRKLVIISCYFSGVSTILCLAFYLIAAGTYKLLDPGGFNQVVSGNVTDPSSIGKGAAFYIYFALVCVAFLATYVWSFLVWGAYRDLMQVSRMRSLVAFVIFLGVSPLLLAAQSVMSYVFLAYSVKSPVPSDLVGMWQATQQSDANGVHSVDQLVYNFEAPKWSVVHVGSYFRLHLHGFTNGKCLVKAGEREFGSMVVDGSKIVLAPHRRFQSTDDGCTGKKSEIAMDNSNAEYQYEIKKEPSGWILCLQNRFGQTCLTPRQK